MTNLPHMPQHAALCPFGHGRLTSFYQAVWRSPYQTHSIGPQYILVGRQTQPPGGGIEGREKLILGQHLRASQLVEQSGFARVGVTDDRCQRPMIALTRGSLGRTLTPDGLQFTGNSSDPSGGSGSCSSYVVRRSPIDQPRQPRSVPIVSARWKLTRQNSSSLLKAIRLIAARN